MTLFELVKIFGIKKTKVPGLSCGVVCEILHLAVSVEHRLVTDRQTDTRLRHTRASMALRGNDAMLAALCKYQI